MDKHIISCPCCGEKIIIEVNGSGTPTAFLFEKIPISQSELAEKYGIELGVVESDEQN